MWGLRIVQGVAVSRFCKPQVVGSSPTGGFRNTKGLRHKIKTPAGQNRGFVQILWGNGSEFCISLFQHGLKLGDAGPQLRRVVGLGLLLAGDLGYQILARLVVVLGRH